MRILIVSNYFFPEIGAAPNRIYNLAKGLSKKHKVEVIAPLPNYPYGKIHENYKGKLFKVEYLDEIKVYRYFIYPSKSKKIVSRIFSMLSFSFCLWLSRFHLNQIKSIDAVIIQNSPLMVSFSSIILFKRILKRKVVLNVSDLWPESALDLGYVKEGRFYNVLKRIEKFNYKNSDVILGQSQEIIDNIKLKISKPFFLYRNIQPNHIEHIEPKTAKVSMVYAGLLGVAQGICEILDNVDFNHIDLIFDIYGDGVEKDNILEQIEKKKFKNVNYRGIVSKDELHKILSKYHFALVPLTTKIKGAVPSKLFELIAHGIPVIYMGYGEAGHIVRTYDVGYVVESKDYKLLKKYLNQITNVSDEAYLQLQNNCKMVSMEEFNFEKQLEEFIFFIKEQI